MDETRFAAGAKIKAANIQSLLASEGARVPSFETMDRLGRAVTAKAHPGRSRRTRCTMPGSTGPSHLVNAPGRLVELGIEAVNIGARLARFAANGLSEHAEPPFAPQADDRRFSDQGLEAAPIRAVAAGLPGAGSLVAQARRARCAA